MSRGFLLVLIVEFFAMFVVVACAPAEEPPPLAVEKQGAAAGEQAGLLAAVGKLDVRFARFERKLAGLEEMQQDILTALEFMAVDVDAIKRNTWETLISNQTQDGADGPEAPEAYRRLFEPETRAALVELAATKGVRLLADRLEVGAIIIQNRVPLEFFAVVSGGKEHEAIVALTGNVEHGAGRPQGLAGMINACILALGFTPGKPVRGSTDGKLLPPEGETIYLYLEWEAEGEQIRARAEDLVYNLDRKQAMSREKWVYVGSRFDRDYATSEVIYVADITGDVVATYSWPNTIIDNTTSEGSDDIFYSCFTPRIPPVGTKVTMVFSREPLPAKEFPEYEEEKEAGGSTGEEEREGGSDK